MFPPAPQTTGNNVGGGWWFRSSNPISMSGDEDTNSTNNMLPMDRCLKGMRRPSLQMIAMMADVF
jgi:hypothetical protein